MTAWYWLRLPSGKILNMALVAAIEPADNGVLVYLGTSLPLYYKGADAETILAWVPGDPVPAEPEAETVEDAD